MECSLLNIHLLDPNHLFYTERQEVYSLSTPLQCIAPGQSALTKASTIIFFCPPCAFTRTIYRVCEYNT